MKITTLIENSNNNKNNLYSEHGLSIFIETSNCNILFDTGQSGNFVYNAEKLNVDLSKIDYLILSHAHYDHCNGVKKLFETYNINPQLVVSKHFFENLQRYHLRENYKYIGINFDKDFIDSKNLKINYVDDEFTLTPSISIFSNFNRTNKFESLNPNMQIKIGNNYFTDNFRDEISLAIDTKNGLLIIVGCSHPGLMNIIDTIKQKTNKKIFGVIGGTHLVEASTERINATADYLNKLNIKLIGASHCTGDLAVNIIKDKCSNFFVNQTGTEIKL